VDDAVDEYADTTAYPFFVRTEDGTIADRLQSPS
jgi:hypothetical protein